MPCQSPRIRIAEVASLELFYFLPDWRRRRRRNPDVTDGFGFDQLLRARRRRHLQPTQNSGTDVGVVDDDVVSSVGIPGVGIRVEEKRHRRRCQDPRRPKRHLQQRQLRVAEALVGVGVDNDVDQLVQLHVDDVTAAEAAEFPTPESRKFFVDDFRKSSPPALQPPLPGFRPRLARKFGRHLVGTPVTSTAVV